MITAGNNTPPPPSKTHTEQHNSNASTPLYSSRSGQNAEANVSTLEELRAELRACEAKRKAAVSEKANLSNEISSLHSNLSTAEAEV